MIDDASNRSEDFVISDNPETLTDPAFQGTNASRFAIAGLIDGEPQLVSTHENQWFEQFGFTEVAFQEKTEGRWTDIVFADYFSSSGRKENASWNPPEVLLDSWARLNNGDPEARVAFLAAGICSHLERESAAAAVSFIGTVPPETLSQLSSLKRTSLNLWWDYEKDVRDGSPWWPTPGFALGPAFTSPFAETTSEPWDGEAWSRYSQFLIARALKSKEGLQLIAVIVFLARLRTAVARQSADSVVVEFALALDLSSATDDPPPPPFPSSEKSGAATAVSTMIHGTWGWKGDWWESGGSFHDYISTSYRPGLYGGGQEYSWSGSLSQKHRKKAAERFERWAEAETNGRGLQTVFAHSYGAEVAARAVNSGAGVDQLVMMSAPVNRNVLQLLTSHTRLVDIRLQFDIVLALARERQRMPSHPHVTEFVVNRALWSHSATHTQGLWDAENIAI
jgi:hypothetical protein